jgi:hypothetical protein
MDHPLSFEALNESRTDLIRHMRSEEEQWENNEKQWESNEKQWENERWRSTKSLSAIMAQSHPTYSTLFKQDCCLNNIVSLSLPIVYFLTRDGIYYVNQPSSKTGGLLQLRLSYICMPLPHLRHQYGVFSAACTVQYNGQRLSAQNILILSSHPYFLNTSDQGFYMLNISWISKASFEPISFIQ